VPRTGSIVAVGAAHTCGIIVWQATATIAWFEASVAVTSSRKVGRGVKGAYTMSCAIHSGITEGSTIGGWSVEMLCAFIAILTTPASFTDASTVAKVTIVAGDEAWRRQRTVTLVDAGWTVVVISAYAKTVTFRSLRTIKRAWEFAITLFCALHTVVARVAVAVSVTIRVERAVKA
jgi:hypothetical protein